jgi:hypothetical protein
MNGYKKSKVTIFWSMWSDSGFGGLGVSVLVFSTQVRGFKPGFLKAKNPQHAFLRRRSKAVGPMSHICGM